MRFGYFDLVKFCKSKNIEFLSSVFDSESVSFLQKKLKIKKIKIPSGEITNPIILNKINLKNYNVILSTGMSNIKEIVNAINIISKKKIYKIIGNRVMIMNNKYLNYIKKKLIVMHCVTDYPVMDKYANLQCINTLQKKLRLNIGYSDHTKGIVAPLIALIWELLYDGLNTALESVFKLSFPDTLPSSYAPVVALYFKNALLSFCNPIPVYWERTIDLNPVALLPSASKPHIP